MPDTAELVLKDGRTKTVKTAELKNGDVILIRPGENIAADGEVIEGESDVNEALITGESTPVKKARAVRLLRDQLMKQAACG